ncbi:MAG: F0F1 ATP synthase subunit B [Pseudomonadota bacterium]
MNINATLLGQMITFAVFIWFTVKFIWPPMIKAMKERQRKIADGLAESDRGRRELELADRQVKTMINDAKLEASHILEHANERAVQVIEEAKEQARHESQRLVDQAAIQIEQQTNSAREKLRAEVADIAVLGAGKVLGKAIDANAHADILDQLASEL